MSDIDDKIREALKPSADSDELFEEQTLLAEVVAPFRGRRRWVNYVGFVYGFAGIVVAVWSGIRLFTTDVPSEQLHWLAICGLAIVCTAFSKVYFWMEMHTNRTLREVKRVELLLLEKLNRKED